MIPNCQGGDVELVHEFTLRVARGETFAVGAGPSGRRNVAAIGSGTVTGERINGMLVGPGADWAVLGGDRFFAIDVRAQIRTDDGAVLLLTYTGSLELNAQVQAALGGADTGPDDHYYRIHARLESGDERYAWVNRTLFVGQGRFAAGDVVYDVARVS
jgi:hypothetical protein